MKYFIQFQTETKYKNVSYGHNSVYNSACGCASLCNALENAGIAKVPLLDMCKFSVNHGARESGGTNEDTLLKAASQKWNFEYKCTSKNAELIEHLKNGGTAILHAGDSYKLFSNGGHYVCAVGAKGNDVIILDSYWYDGKYTQTSLRKDNVKVLGKGIVQTSLYCCGKATIDRSPSYYLIKKIKTKSKTAPTFKEGKKYTLRVNLKLRKSPERSDNYVSLKDVTKYTKTNCLNNNSEAVLKAGVEITAQKVVSGKDGNVYVKTSSGWLLAWNKQTYSINLV